MGNASLNAPIEIDVYFCINPARRKRSMKLDE